MLFQVLTGQVEKTTIRSSKEFFVVGVEDPVLGGDTLAGLIR